MEFLVELARRPLFRFLAALIVLLLTEQMPLYGLGAAFVWAIWIQTPRWVGKFAPIE